MPCDFKRSHKLWFREGSDLGKCESERGKADRGRFRRRSEISNQEWNGTQEEAKKTSK